MKSKPRLVKICFFLVSVFFCSDLFSQNSVSNEVYRNQDLGAIKNPTGGIPHLFFYSLSWPVQANPSAACIQSVSDTTKKDRDGDGVVDSLDKCPDEKGVIQYDGCPVPDSDNDGIADDKDGCPTIRGLAKYNGCPPPDKDGDKINDEDDKCPTQPGVARYKGCPVGDKDGDGVNDDDDKCISIPGTVNNEGCPENKKSANPSRKTKRSNNAL